METIVLILIGLGATMAIVVLVRNKSRRKDCNDCSQKGNCPSVQQASLRRDPEKENLDDSSSDA